MTRDDMKNGERQAGKLWFGGWSMPDPADEALREAMWAARHNLSRLTQTQAHLIAGAADAYVHFASHPTSTARVIAQLREIRRAVKRHRREK